MKKQLDNLFKSLLGPDIELSCADEAAHKDQPSDQVVSAFELESRILYSATPVEFVDPQPEPIEIADSFLQATETYEVAAMSATVPTYELLISSLGNGDSWDASELVSFDDPNLVLGPATDGTFSPAFDLNAFASNNVLLRDAHFVHHDITLGTGSTSFDLQVGDILFTVDGGGTLTGNSTSITAELDVYVFRPDHLGVYDSGEFHYLVDNPYPNILGGLTLIDKPGGITLGDGTTIDEGTIVTASNIPFLGNWISIYETEQVGQGTSEGDETPFFIPAFDFGINVPISGLHIVQDSMSLGGIDFFEGDILFSIVNSDGSVGSNGVQISSRDIGLLRYTGGSWEATRLVDGSDVGLSNFSELVDAITIGIANTAPTSISIDNASVVENTDTSGGLVVGSLSALDNENNPLTFSVSGSSPFSVVGNDLVLTGVGIDFETTPSYTVTVRATDPGNLFVETNLTISVTDVDETPTVSLHNVLLEVPENTTAQTKVADIVVEDDALGSWNLSLGGADAGLFEIIGDELFLKAGSNLDFETQEQLDVIVEVYDPALGTSPDDTASQSIDVLDVNEAPTVTLQNTIDTLPEDFDTTTRTKIADILVTDDELGNNRLSDNGPDQGLFEIIGNEFFLRAGVTLDFESHPILSVSVNVDDLALGEGDVAWHTITIQDVNEAPTVSLINTLNSIDETNTLRTKVADIVVSDDDLGTESLSLSGTDAGLFEIAGNELFLIANAGLDHETVPQLDVTVSIDDAQIGTTVDDSVSHTLLVADVNEAPEVLNPLASFNVAEDAADRVIDLSNVFTDEDLNTLSFSLGANSDPSIAAAQVIGNSLVIDFLDDQFGSFDLEIEASDGEFSTTDTLTVDVRPINDAPILSGGANLSDIYRDSDPTGETIRDLVEPLFSDIDVGDQFAGIGVVSNDAPASEGSWQYFDTAGNQWRDIGVVRPLDPVTYPLLSTFLPAHLLSADKIVRFLPATGYVGIPTPLEFFAVDSSGIPFNEPTLKNLFTSLVGDITPYSEATAELGIEVKQFGVAVTPTSPGTTSESGSNASFNVVLLSAPASDVSISVTSDDFSEGIASTSQIVFTTENWATPQIVNVTGVDDLIDDGNQNFTIVLGQTESSDAQYNNIDVDDVALVNIDDDTAGIILSKTVLETDENGSADEFNVSLSSQPTDVVLLNIVTSNPEEVALSTLNVMFTPDNWNTRQSITVTGINDGLNDDDAPFSISIVASSAGDPNFNSLNSTTITGTNNSFIAPPIDESVDVISKAVPATIDESESNDVLIDPDFIRREIATEIGVNEFASQARRFFIANSSGKVSWDLDSEISRSNFYRNVDLHEQMFMAQDDKGKLADEAVLESRNRNDFQLDSLWDTLDVLDEDIQNQSSMPQIAAGTVAVTSIFTAGYLTWLIRGGHLLLGLISALPAWSSLDMLAVLSQSDDDEGDEEGGSNSLESLVTSPNESSPETEIDNTPTQRIVDQPQHTAV